MSEDMIDFCMDFAQVKVDGTRPNDEPQIEEEKLGQVPDAQQNSPRSMLNRKEGASSESDIKVKSLPTGGFFRGYWYCIAIMLCIFFYLLI